jgi:O-antigen/teichoic acid export membrane protein
MTPKSMLPSTGETEAVRSGLALTAGTAWNIAPLVRALGTDRFGVLTLGWMLMGYFDLFDLCMGRATTKALAEAVDAGATRDVRDLFWSSAALHAALGAVGGLLLACLVPSSGR